MELEIAIERDAKQIEREDEIESYVRIYGGELHQIWRNEEDAVYFKLTIQRARSKGHCTNASVLIRGPGRLNAGRDRAAMAGR